MMNPGMMGMGSMMMNGMFESQNITSSVKLLPAMMNGISSQVKISLGEAVMNAQKELGNSSHAVAPQSRGRTWIFSLYNIGP